MCIFTFPLSDNIERAVYYVVEAEVGVLLLFSLRVRVGAQKQRLVLMKKESNVFFRLHARTDGRTSAGTLSVITVVIEAKFAVYRPYYLCTCEL